LRTTDVLIIGAGIIGTSAAYHLSAKGIAVSVLERESIGSGSTAVCVGGFRAQQPHPLEVGMSLDSMAAFDRFEDEVGATPGLHRCGYLLLATDRAEADTLEERVAMQRENGPPVELLGRSEIESCWPAVACVDVILASYCPLDGYADPETICRGYADAARRASASILEGVEVSSIVVRRGRAVGVTTSCGERLEAPVVVLAAGPWSRGLALDVGLDLPAHPFPRHAFLRGTHSWR